MAESLPASKPFDVSVPTCGILSTPLVDPPLKFLVVHMLPLSATVSFLVSFSPKLP